MGKRRCILVRDPKAALVSDARLDGFPATHFASYSQAADVVRLPEQKWHGDGAYAGKTPEKRSFQAKRSLPEKRQRAFLLAEQVGFEPTGLERLTDFESASL